jgi:predicted nucleic acid-binding protein
MTPVAQGRGLMTPVVQGRGLMTPVVQGRALMVPVVVDANVIAHLLLPSQHTAAVEALRRAHPAWASAKLWRYEFANVLWKHHASGGLATEAVLQVWESTRILNLLERDPEPREALRLAVESGVSAYDCQFVALARELGAPLYTFDARVLHAFPDLAVRPDKA